MAGAGILSKVGKRVRRANRAIDKALAPIADQRLLTRGQAQVRKPTEAQVVSDNLGKRKTAFGTGRGRKQGAIAGTLVGTGAGAGFAMGSSDDKKPKPAAKPAAKKKPAPKPAAKKKPPKTVPKSTTKNGRVNPSDYPIYNKDTKSGKAFRAAFKAAVRARKKTFRFEGRTYNTKKKK
jgi:hypothetical protein